MPSIRSKFALFALKNRHLLKLRFRPERIDWNTSTDRLRHEFEEAALKYNKLPEGISVVPVEINGMAAEWILPAGGAKDKVIFYTHGGGYVTGSCADHRMHVAKFVQATGAAALLYEYRLAPEHPFPAAVEDTLTAYRWLVEAGTEPENIIIVGESAGGGLCLAALVALRDSGIPLPAAGVAISPWTDLTCSGDSYHTNAKADISLEGSWTVWSSYYTHGSEPTHPWISPIFADLSDLPPILIEVGDAEILLDDARGFAEKAEKAGVNIRLHVWPGMVHCFPLLAPLFPEASQAMQEICLFIREHSHKSSPETNAILD